MVETRTLTAESDAELTARVRLGDSRAFAELWHRHHRPAYRAAQQYARTIEPDDLISEAYLRVYRQLLAGRGPTTAFRPYLYSVIRNVAISKATAPRLATEPLDEDTEDDRINADPLSVALDRSLTSRAFHSLPDRWQMVLWYTEIEGMDPHEVAGLLGLTPNGVAALALRAREGLREAWLQAHINEVGATGACTWARERMGKHIRDNLGSRDRAKFDAHLAECTKCLLVSAELDEVGSRLAFVMLPLVLGGTAGISLLETLAQPSSMPLAESLLPALPDAGESIAHVDAAALPILGTMSLALTLGRRTRTIAIIGAIVLLGSLALGVHRSTQEPPATSPTVVVETP